MMYCWVALYNGEWRGKRMLDGKEVPIISAYFEDSEDAGEPKVLPENINSVYQGSIFLGDGFLLTHEEANSLIHDDSHNNNVICKVINGDEINNQPTQLPRRSVINFHVWTEAEASRYTSLFSIVEQRVKPERMKQKD
jgi:hypothetical protein